MLSKSFIYDESRKRFVKYEKRGTDFCSGLFLCSTKGIIFEIKQ